jgi:NADH-quinone oxidoreductase subunit H
VAKVWTFLFVFMWLRATLPRLRYDQFMALGWKLLIPTSLIWIMIVAILHTLGHTGIIENLIAAATLLALVVGVRRLAQGRQTGQEPLKSPQFDPMAGGFPVPPLPGQRVTAAWPASTSVGVPMRNGKHVHDRVAVAPWGRGDA